MSCRAAAAAPRRLVGPNAVFVAWLPTVEAESDTFVSTGASLIWSYDIPSSSAAIMRVAVGVPCPSSTQPVYRVAVLSELICR